MAYAVPLPPASSSPMLFQQPLSIAARRAQLKSGTGPGPVVLSTSGVSKPKKPTMSLTLDLSHIPPKTLSTDGSGRFPFGRREPPVLPTEAELADMTPQARITAENTIFNWSLGQKRFDQSGREILPSTSSSLKPTTDDDDDAESVVSLVHSSTSASAASSSLPTPLTGKSVSHETSFADNDDTTTTTTTTPRRSSTASTSSSLRSGRSDRSRNVAFLCLAHKHVTAAGEDVPTPCSCVECDTPSG